MRTVSAERFEAECLELPDDVAETGETIVVTKAGKPHARIVPFEEAVSLRGSVQYLVSTERLIAPVDEPWDAEAE